MKKLIDVLAIGSAIVDIMCFAQDEDIHRMNLIKGTMNIVDDDAAIEYDQDFKPEAVRSGGSVANSLAHISKLGGSCQFIGKVAVDDIGRIFIGDLAQLSIKYTTPALKESDFSGRCYIFVTPDAQRTMCPLLGASSKLSIADLDKEAISSSSYLFIEGYNWYSATAKNLVLEATKFAKTEGTKVAFSLSDTFLVDRFRTEIQPYVEEYVDLLFANEKEAEQLYSTNGVGQTMNALQKSVETVVMTRGALGAVAAVNCEQYICPANAVEKVVDTTGAGDAYAAGILFGLSRDKPIQECMEIASNIAAEVIQHVGGRLRGR